LYLRLEPTVTPVDDHPLLTIANETAGGSGVDRMATVGVNFTPAGTSYAFRESHGRAAL